MARRSIDDEQYHRLKRFKSIGWNMDNNLVELDMPWTSPILEIGDHIYELIFDVFVSHFRAMFRI
jgi:hypothetical protein